MKKWLLFLLCAFFLFPQAAAAADTEAALREQAATAEVEEALPAAAAELLDGLTISDMRDPAEGLSRLWEKAKTEAFSALKKPLKTAAALLVIAMLSSISVTVCGEEKARRCTHLAAVLAIASLTAGALDSYFSEAAETLAALSEFSKVLLPSMATAAAAAGAVSSASARYLATTLFVDVLLTAAERLILPLLYAYTAAVIAGSAAQNRALSAVAGLLKWLFTALMSGLVLAFTLYLTLTGTISGSADAVTARMAKTAISAALPVVGGILSGAASTVVAAGGLLCSATGIFGLLAVASVCLAPFLRMAAGYLCYRAAAGMAAMLSDDALSALLKHLGTAFGALLGLVGAGALMLFLSLISSMKAVSGL